MWHQFFTLPQIPLHCNNLNITSMAYQNRIFFQLEWMNEFFVPQIYEPLVNTSLTWNTLTVLIGSRLGIIVAVPSISSSSEWNQLAPKTKKKKSEWVTCLCFVFNQSPLFMLIKSSLTAPLIAFLTPVQTMGYSSSGVIIISNTLVMPPFTAGLMPVNEANDGQSHCFNSINLFSGSYHCIKNMPDDSEPHKYL